MSRASVGSGALPAASRLVRMNSAERGRSGTDRCLDQVRRCLDTSRDGAADVILLRFPAKRRYIHVLRQAVIGQRLENSAVELAEHVMKNGRR